MATPSKPPRVRIAPSPTGAPHVGTAYIALFNRAFAKKHGGQFILRIEDTDQDRSRPEYETAIFEALRWLGLEWDEGPDVGGPHGPYRQSERKNIYGEYAQTLIDKGAAYKCWCSAERLDALRREQMAAKAKLGYDKHCQEKLSDAEKAEREASGEPFVVRFAFPKTGEVRFQDLLRGEISVNCADLSDYVLLKSDGFPTYHLANIVDDHLMGITHVIRAEEWISSMPLHWMLYEAFGWERPVFCHMPLLRNSDKSKISKRKNPVSIDFYRTIGVMPDALLNFLALQGYSMPDEREIFSPAEFIEHFDLTRVTTSGPVFDLEKLRHINGENLRRHDPEQRKRLILDHLALWLDRLGEMATGRMQLLSDFSADFAYFSAWHVAVTKETFAPATKRLDAAKLADGLAEFREGIFNLQPHEWAAVPLDALIDGVIAKFEWSAKKDRTAFMQGVRLALSARTFTPPLGETLSAMERFTVVSRLDAAIAVLRQS